MHCYKVDTPHGLLYNLHIVADEDLAVSLKLHSDLVFLYPEPLFISPTSLIGLFYLPSSDISPKLSSALLSVSLTYRVKSAHKIKLNDQQLLQWMVPILLVMLIYLGTWTISATPYAEVVSIQHSTKL